MTKTVLLTGASGYIGGSILAALVADKQFKVRALCRDAGQGEKLQSVDPELIQPVIANFTKDLKVLEQEAASVDIVINAASAQLHEPALALVNGLSKRAGSPGVYIHTSGSSVFSHPSLADRYVKDTEDIYELEKSLPSYHQIDTDIAVVDLAQKLSVPYYIVVPPTIYGAGTGPIKTYSHQIPSIIYGAVHKGIAGYIGDGTSIWPHVHINDLCEIYVKLSTTSSAPNAPKSGYFFAEAGMHSWKQLADDVAAGLRSSPIAKGKYNNVQTKSLTVKEGSDMWTWSNEEFGAAAFGSNSKIKAVRAREEFGWEPAHGVGLEEFKKDVAMEVEDFLTRGGVDSYEPMKI